MAVSTQPGGDHDRSGHDLASLAHMPVGRVEPDVHEQLMIQPQVRSTVTSSSMPLQIRDTLDLEMPVSQPSALTRSSTFLVEVR